MVLMIGGAWLAVSILMVGVWVLQRRLGDAGIVDVAWTYSVGLLSILFCWMGAGDPTRRIVVAVLAGIWSIRLGTYVLYRVLKLPEDGRYVTLKKQAGVRAQRKLFEFYQYQAFGAVLFSLPMLLAATNPLPIGVSDFLGITIWLVAAGGESLADRQLSAFRKQGRNQGAVCQSGLWKYSRHPNYFFEWLHWWAYVALAWQVPCGGWHGWLSLIGPVAMYYFINFVTGIPPTERQALLSRGDAYREYQKTTSSFFPWLPKKESLTS
jgi:steroid 5-alpha reductase family enzyme